MVLILRGNEQYAYHLKIGGTHMEITYTRVGDYYLPNLAAPESPKVGR